MVPTDEAAITNFGFWAARSAGIVGSLMVMPGSLRGGAAIFHCQLQDGSLGKLTRVRPVDFLPGRVAGRYRRRRLGLAAGDFIGLDKRVAAAFIEVNPDDIAGA